VLATDVSEQKFDFPCEYKQLDVTNEERYKKLVDEHDATYIVHMAGILSALGERNPDLAIDVNVNGVLNALRIARSSKAQLFIPSSIAVFGGDHFPKVQTPVDTILQPTTVYGVSKIFAEQMGEYFSKKYEIDFRSIRYPGIISSKKFAFNGTTDYSTEIFFHALEKNHYSCWLREDSAMPMMYIDDCIDATLQFLKADKEKLTRNTYNLAGISFTPEELAESV